MPVLSMRGSQATVVHRPLSRSSTGGAMLDGGSSHSLRAAEERPTRFSGGLVFAGEVVVDHFPRRARWVERNGEDRVEGRVRGRGRHANVGKPSLTVAKIETCSAVRPHSAGPSALPRRDTVTVHSADGPAGIQAGMSDVYARPDRGVFTISGVCTQRPKRGAADSAVHANGGGFAAVQAAQMPAWRLSMSSSNAPEASMAGALPARPQSAATRPSVLSKPSAAPAPAPALAPAHSATAAAAAAVVSRVTAQPLLPTPAQASLATATAVTQQAGSRAAFAAPQPQPASSIPAQQAAVTAFSSFPTTVVPAAAARALSRAFSKEGLRGSDVPALQLEVTSLRKRNEELDAANRAWKSQFLIRVQSSTHDRSNSAAHRTACG